MGDGRGDGQWGAGNNICGRDYRLKVRFFTFWLQFGDILDVFGWILGAPGLTVGSNWAPWVYVGPLGVTFGASRLHFGWALELLDCLWRSVSVTLMPRVSKMDAAGDQADIA